MKRLLLAIFATLSMGAASASTITYTIADLLPLGGNYSIANTGQTYGGTGFVGMYDDNTFAHLFGLEGSYSRTNMQVDIGGLAGSTVSAATLTFVLMENFGTGGTLTITGFDGTGNLGYAFAAPAAAYGTASGGFVNGNGAAQSYDVTSILQSAVGASEDWLGLHLQNSDFSRWTYTYDGLGYGPDRAQVRLTVEYSAVPEPTTVALLGLGLAGLAATRRRKQ